MDASASWASKLEGAVKRLFYILFTLEITMLGITALLKRQEIDDIFLSVAMAFLFGGFILLCINNYAEWSGAVMNGMARYADLTGNNSGANILINPLESGLNIFKRIIRSGFSITSPVDGLGKLLVAFSILISFAFITLNIIYIKCEAAVAVGAGFILLGFGGCHFFKDYAINLMRYILSVGFKLYVLHIVLGLGFTFIENLPLGNMSWEELAVVLVTALIIQTLSKSLPDVAAGIINGSHVNTGGNLLSTARQVMGMAAMATAGVAAGGAAMAGGAKGVAGGVSALKQAVSVAKGEGAQGFGGVAKGAFSALNEARKQLKADKEGPNIRSKLEAMREVQKFNNPGTAAQSGAADKGDQVKPSAKGGSDAQK